ncbi:uncharacterized protein [Littorina saxatilis]|uniref:uncharacterized protein isoform X2 n=1 Tax=Littorina saxatilis TaxID=31220 RepID=UPI0038B68199
MYTVMRYTVQDLSAWSLVCLVMERCSAAARRKPLPYCLLLTVGRYQWALRHMGSKIFLLTLTVLALVINLGMVYCADHGLDVRNMMDCFSTWKSEQDFSKDFRSLAMSHVLLSIIAPSMSCAVAYTCLHCLTGSGHKRSDAPTDGQGVAPAPTITPQPGATGDGVTHSRRVHLGFANSRDVTAHTSGQRLLNDVPNDVTRTSDVTVTCPDYYDTVNNRGTYGRSFLDRLYNTIRSREFVLSVVYVEDSRLVAEPPVHLGNDFNAMASVAALFYVLMMTPQLVYVVTGVCLKGSLDWPLMKNVGLAVDLVVNNRINFTLFLYVFVSGRRMSSVLFNVLASLSSFCCPCISPNPPPSRGIVLRDITLQGQGQRVGGGGQCQRVGGQSLLRCPGRQPPQNVLAVATAEGGGKQGQGQQVDLDGGGQSEGDVTVPKVLSIMTPC